MNEGYVNVESLTCQNIILASLLYIHIRYFHNGDQLTGSSISFYPFELEYKKLIGYSKRIKGTQESYILSYL